MEQGVAATFGQVRKIVGKGTQFCQVQGIVGYQMRQRVPAFRDGPVVVIIDKEPGDGDCFIVVLGRFGRGSSKAIARITT